MLNSMFRKSFAEPLLGKRYCFPAPPTLPLGQKANRLMAEFESSSPERIQYPCFVCEQSDFVLLANVDRHGFYCPVGICRQCGHVQQTNGPSSEQLGFFYRSYFHRIYGYDSPKMYFQQQKQEGRRILHWIGRTPGEKTALELGCGSGGILEAFKAKGWNVCGVDHPSTYTDYGRKRGLNIQRRLSETGSKPFELIILSHVLEHLPNPVDTLKDLRGRLRSGGLLYVEVPSLHEVRGDYYRSDLLRYFQNAHLSSFSTGPLQALLCRAGFEVTRMDRFIHCLATPGARPQTPIPNKFDETLSEIRRMERARPWFPFANAVKRRLKSALPLVRPRSNQPMPG